MKKITLLTAFVTVCSFAFAQTKMAQVQHLPLSKKAISLSQLGAANQVSKPAAASNFAGYAKKAVIWSEDFSGGIPGGWTNTGTPAAALWEYRGPATTPNVSVGGRGDCSSGIPIASPTAANGFLIFDSNWLDVTAYCGGPAGGIAASPQIGILQTDAINLSAEPSVMLTFYTDMREFSGTQSVNVSINGGSTWTEVWEAGLGSNVAFAGQVSVNISSIAANQADVRLQFDWDGDYYEWMIDDITLETAPSLDLALVTDSDMVYLDAWQVPLYGQIPFNQTGTSNYAARVANIGSNTQTNVILNVDVKNGVSSVFNSSDTLASLAPLSNALFTITPGFSPTATGDYTVVFNVSSDSTDANLANNSDTVSYKVTDSVFARDNGFLQYQLNVASYGISGPTPNGSSYEFGNWYETVKADTAKSISVVLGGSTIVGTIIQGKIFAADGTTLLGSTAFYTIQAGDVGVFPNFPVVTIPLTANLSLGDTSNYVVTIADYSGTDTATRIIASADGHQFATSFLMYSGGLATIAETPFVRLNLKASNPCLTSPFTSVSASSTVASCGNANGTATANVAGGNPPYNYIWSDPGSQTSATATGLAPGSYTVTINDAFSCDTSATVTVTGTPAVNVNILSSNNPSACAVNDGNATASVSGGTAPFAYSWTPGGQTTATADSLGAGTYTVVVTDTNGCSDTAIVSLSDPGGAVLTISNNSPVSCFGGNDGSATVSASGGTLPLTYLWQPAGGADSTANNLPANTYTVNVTDSALCQSSIIVIITQPAALSLSPSSTGVSCFGDTDGKASVAASGGTGAYTYLWNTASTNDSISGLAPGAYSVVVRDANNCVDSTSVNVGEPAVLAVTGSGTINEDTIGNNNGAMSVTASGGTTAYTYNWVPAPGGGQGTSSVTGLSPGVYTVTVTDANGCIATYSDTILAGVPSGINEFKNTLTFSIYPNPTKGQFVVEFSNQKKDDYLVEVKNILGQLVYSEDISNIAGKFTKQINLPGRRGVYFLSITNTSGTRTEKLVVY